jgi:O-antigen/teichoic acid export membrane protein
MQASSRKAVLHRLTRSQLAKNTFWSLLGYGSRLVIQAVYFVIIARKLGVQNYGAFVGVVAIAAFFAPFAAWGSYNILVKEVVRDRRTFPAYLGASLTTCVISGLALIAIAALLSEAFFSRAISVWIPILVCVSDLLLARLVDVCGSAFQAFDRVRMMAFLQAMTSSFRLLAAVVLLVFFRSPASAVTWATLYAAGSAVSAVISLILVRAKLGWGPLSMRPMKGKYREGFHFAVSWAAQGAYNDIDKTLVGRIDSFAAAGFYSAAYRIEDAIFSPFRAFLQASYARFFREGTAGIRGSAAFARRVLPWALVYGILASAFLFLISPLLPLLLGPGYQKTANALRWISLLPLLRSIGYLGGCILTGADRQSVRSTIQLAIAAMNFGLNLALIPYFGWVAAAWTSLGSDGLCALALWVAATFIASRQDRASPTRA